jgi:mycothiol system anti-sigma-R factor
MIMSFLGRVKRLLGGNGDGHQDHDEDDCPECRPISCMEALERVHEYLDGELGEVSHSEVEHHFSMCQRCYPHLRLEERFRDILHQSQTQEKAPDHLRQQVLDLLAAEAGKMN